MAPTELIEMIESAAPSKALDRHIALAVGWHRYSPSETGRKYPGWIAPEDFIGEYVGEVGRRTPKLDSLHGTEIWRDPRPYSTSIDAAMTLVPDGCGWVAGWGQTRADEPMGSATVTRKARFIGYDANYDTIAEGEAATPALALCAAALKARAAQ